MSSLSVKINTLSSVDKDIHLLVTGQTPIDERDLEK